MIKIIDIAETLCDKLSINSEVKKFKISINLNFSLDVNVVSDNLTTESFKEKYLKGWDLYKINCEVYTSQEAEDEYVEPIFAAGNGIDYGQRFRLSSLFEISDQLRNDMNRDSLPPIVTFYSYKGGMGRTTTMVSYAIKLALQGKKVFIIDADLEAPGYLNFFSLPEHQGLRAGMINGLVEYLSDLEFVGEEDDAEKAIDLQNYCLNIVDGNHAVGLDPRLRNIYLMPAGNLNEVMQDDEFSTSAVANKHLRAYMEGLSRINLGNPWSILQNFKRLLNQIKDTFDPDVVLIDSRTGFNDVMGTATTYLSDVIVGFFGSNNQTVPGLKKLLQNYQENDFKLMVVNSILPDKQELREEDNFKRLNDFIEDFYRFKDIRREAPMLLRLHRSSLLEQLGIDENTDKSYLNLIDKGAFDDYKLIFEQIDQIIQDVLQEGKTAFQRDHKRGDALVHNKKKRDPSKMDTWTLRNHILQGMKRELAPITDFAEDQERMPPRTFFYRYCMNEFFDENKFLIMGLKGTGKTYLYRALAETTDTNEEIAKVILSRANKYRSIKGFSTLPEDVSLYKFIDIISATSAGTKRLAFSDIDYAAIDNPQLYFKRLWQVHTWLSIMQDPDFDEIKQQSSLRDFMIDDFTGAAGLKVFNDIIKMGVDALIAIEDDMRKINKWCSVKGKRLYLLYDQLDTRINPRYWDTAVSPLINYWRENFAMYSNLFPKIFVRTDLFQRIGGTNTARMKYNILSIEWSIDEIFGYIVKLITCDNERKHFFIEMLNRVYKGKDAMIAYYEKQFNENDNQLIRPNISSLAPLIRVIFGKFVTGLRDGARVTPYDYFAWNLANADGRTYSLRPFITTLDRNAIEKSLARVIPNRYVQWLIAPEDYANREVRNLAAQQYFDDLTREDFSADLIKFRDVLQSDKGKPYRRKTLREIEFNDLINLVMDSYGEFVTAKTGEDLKLMLYASGIMAEKPISGEKIYRFAPLYYYYWGLKSTKYDKGKDRVFFEDVDDNDESN